MTLGYIKAIKEIGEEPIICSTEDIYGGNEVTLKILREHPNVKAIMTGEDLLSLSVNML